MPESKPTNSGVEMEGTWDEITEFGKKVSEIISRQQDCSSNVLKNGVLRKRMIALK
ncbi:MAG: hypothetical protein H8Z69_06015 [Nanohaloarchaea archaeon]|nr:hypothetical protein [Candidatus Nanohaloarchaea archaeon]